jgi:hypothetical protein
MVKCACPPCRARFVPARVSHKYCSPYCQGRAARWRARLTGRPLSTRYYHAGGYYARNPEAYK